MGPEEIAITGGPDDENPGRYLATIRWDNHADQIHESISIVNEPTLDEAVDEAIRWWRDKRNEPWYDR